MALRAVGHARLPDQHRLLKALPDQVVGRQLPCQRLIGFEAVPRADVDLLVHDRHLRDPFQNRREPRAETVVVNHSGKAFDQRRIVVKFFTGAGLENHLLLRKALHHAVHDLLRHRVADVGRLIQHHNLAGVPAAAPAPPVVARLEIGLRRDRLHLVAQFLRNQRRIAQRQRNRLRGDSEHFGDIRHIPGFVFGRIHP